MVREKIVDAVEYWICWNRFLDKCGSRSKSLQSLITEPDVYQLHTRIWRYTYHNQTAKLMRLRQTQTDCGCFRSVVKDRIDLQKCDVAISLMISNAILKAKKVRINLLQCFQCIGIFGVVDVSVSVLSVESVSVSRWIHWDQCQCISDSSGISVSISVNSTPLVHP